MKIINRLSILNHLSLYLQSCVFISSNYRFFLFPSFFPFSSLFLFYFSRVSPLAQLIGPRRAPLRIPSPFPLFSVSLPVSFPFAPFFSFPACLGRARQYSHDWLLQSFSCPLLPSKNAQPASLVSLPAGCCLRVIFLNE